MYIFVRIRVYAAHIVNIYITRCFSSHVYLKQFPKVISFYLSFQHAGTTNSGTTSGEHSFHW